jgi:hypothetical protein
MFLNLLLIFTRILIAYIEAQKALFWTLFEFTLNRFEFALFLSWMLKELLYLGPKRRLRWLFSSICVQNLNRAVSATFRPPLEPWLKKMCKIKQPIRNRRWETALFQDTNRAIGTHLVGSLKLGLKQIENLNVFWDAAKELKMPLKGRLLKNLKYQVSHVHVKPFKTIPLSSFSNLVTQSL